MSDILPKFKVYMLICVVSFLISVTVVLSKLSFSVTDLLGLTIGTFVPFVNLTVLFGTNYPIELASIITTIMVILSGIEVFLLAMFVFQTVHNLIWNPDV